VVSIDTGKRKLLGVEWTGISVEYTAGVDLLAKRKIPAPALSTQPVWTYWLREKSLPLH
jgi:hypothetical protein